MRRHYRSFLLLVVYYIKVVLLLFGITRLNIHVDSVTTPNYSEIYAYIYNIYDYIIYSKIKIKKLSSLVDTEKKRDRE